MSATERVLAFLRAWDSADYERFYLIGPDGTVLTGEDIITALNDQRRGGIAAAARIGRIHVGPGQWAAFEQSMRDLETIPVAPEIRAEAARIRSDPGSYFDGNGTEWADEWFTAVTCRVPTCLLTATHRHRVAELSVG